MGQLPAPHDPNAAADREMIGAGGAISGLEAAGEIFEPVDSIGPGETKNACPIVKAILLATLGR